MLNEFDREYMRTSHEETRQGRTIPVQITQRTIIGEDPFTGDKEYGQTTVEVPVTWSAATGGEDLKYVNGVEVQAGDFLAEFPVDTDLSEVDSVGKDGANFALIEYDTVGIMGDNRIEALLRRVT